MEALEESRRSTVLLAGLLLVLALPGIGVAESLASAPADVAAGAPANVNAGAPASAPVHDLEEGSGGPLCGLYCLYAALLLEQKEVDFADLVNPEYIRSRQGVTMAVLEFVARKHGLQAALLSKLTPRMLQDSSYPIILHVKSKPDQKEYDHYELFLGMEDGKVRLFDPGKRAIVKLPIRDLTLIWKGNGLVLSSTPINVGTMFAKEVLRQLTYIAVCAAVVLIIIRLRRRRSSTATNRPMPKLLRLSVAQCIFVTGLGVIGGAVYHVCREDGFLARANATEPIEKAYLGSLLPKVKVQQIAALVDGGAVLVDARFGRDFDRGHIKGAISIPVYATDAIRHEATKDIPKDARIVLYCQSKACKFAESVAAQLISDGYGDISIFRGGWVEWKRWSEEKNQNP